MTELRPTTDADGLTATERGWRLMGAQAFRDYESRPTTDAAAKIAAMRTQTDIEAMELAMQLVPQAFTADDRVRFKDRKLRIQAGKA